jgi:ABC-type sugar transport system permease subunit
VNGTARRWDGLLFVLPFLFFYLVILIYPLLRGMALSFQRVDLFGGGTFVGSPIMPALFADATFIQSLVNTFVLALMIVPVLTALALALALALKRATRGAAVFAESSSPPRCCRSPSSPSSGASCLPPTRDCWVRRRRRWEPSRSPS